MPDAIDFSNWTSVPTPAQLDCLKSKGVRMAIIGTRGNPMPHFRAQVIACKDAGLTVESYIYLYFAEDAQLQALDALKKMAGLGIRRSWMDVEGIPQGPGKTIAALAEVERLLRQGGYDVGIYTSQSKWPLHTGNTTAFSKLALWDAHWRYPSGDSRGIDQPPPAFVPYGGWVSPTIVQYAGDVQYCGLNLDLNMVYVNVPPPPDFDEEDHMNRLNGVDPGWESHAIPDKHVHEVRLDAPWLAGRLPQGADSVDLQVFVRKGAAIVLDGDGNPDTLAGYAGEVGANDQRTIRARPVQSPNGRIVKIKAVGETIVGRVGILAWYA